MAQHQDNDVNMVEVGPVEQQPAPQAPAQPEQQAQGAGAPAQVADGALVPAQQPTAASGPAEEENKVPVYSEEQMARMVRCRTFDEPPITVEAPWHLLMQSRTFAHMWDNLQLENSTEPFEFPLNQMTHQCFERVLAWMREHHGLPEPVVKEDPVTTERKWFELTEWEKEFFTVDFETLKEYFLAANFLDIRSLFLYCAQECARAIMDKDAETIREMLCLPDDLTEEDKQRMLEEYGLPSDQPIAAAAGAGSADGAGPSGIGPAPAAAAGPSGSSSSSAGPPPQHNGTCSSSSNKSAGGTAKGGAGEGNSSSA